MFLDELSCSVDRIQTSPDSSANDSFNAMPIICRREAHHALDAYSSLATTTVL